MSFELHLGDCLTVMRTLPDGCVDAVVTDPPYGHSNGNGDLASARIGVKGARQNPLATIENDAPEDYYPLMQGFLEQAARVMKPESSCCCCCCCGGGPNPTFANVALLMDRYLDFFHAVVWDKSARGPGLGWRYRRNYEFVMVAKPKGGKLSWADPDLAVPNVLYVAPVANGNHPTTKPVVLMKKFILWHTKLGDTVLDPFMGSGTTGVACVQTGRSFIGIELDPGYFAIAQKRIEQAAMQPSLFDAMPRTCHEAEAQRRAPVLFSETELEGA
jgi:site-specific DNA-methyltransferase (adenine-specific)